MEKYVKQIETILTYIVVLLVPIAVLPIFPNVFVVPKLVILTWGLGAILILKAAKTYYRGSIKASLGAFDIPLLFLAIAYVASTIAKTPNKMEALLFPGSAIIIVAAVILYFVINQLDERAKLSVRLPLLGAGVIVSLVSLLAVAGLFKGAGMPAFMKEAGFSLIEGAAPTFIFLVSLLPLGIASLLQEADIAKKAFVGTATALIVFGAIVSLTSILPGKNTALQLPGFTTSWVVAIDTLKESPLVGIGPGNYLTAFNRFRPVTYNQTDLWATRFTSGRNFYLTVITEAGILGATALILLFIKILDSFKKIKGDKENDQHMGRLLSILSLIVLSLCLALFPGTISLIFLFAVLLALTARTHKASVDLSTKQEEEHHEGSSLARLPIFLASAPIIVAVLLYAYFSARIIIGEYTYNRALLAAAKNDGRATYDTLRAAIMTNPYVDRYHISHAQLNLTLANAISGKQNLTEEEKKTVSTLIQQAIAEGKNGVALNETRSGNWEVLASIYRAIIPAAKDAQQFAIQTYQQAINLDPFNPNLRIALGTIYYNAKMYDNAIELFKLAVATKQDLSNAHYNLAISYREKGEIEKAIAELNIVLSQVDKTSKDYEVAKATLDEIEKNKPAVEPGVSPTPQVQVDLPSDANPPQPQTTPAPSATPQAF